MKHESQKTSKRTRKVRIIDGAMSTEIFRRDVNLHPISWSGLNSHSHPELIKSIHLDYINAGARMITTNTFAASRHILQAADCSRLFNAVNRMSVEIAIEAREESEIDDVLIAGSLSTLPPLNNPDNAPSGAEVLQNQQDQANLLAASGVDLLLIEMQYDSSSALPLIQACLATELPVWVGITASRRHTGEMIAYRPSGKYACLQTEAFMSLIESVTQQPISAVGVMHTPIEIMHAALAMLRERWNGTAFAYPETGCFDEPNWDFSESVDPADFAEKMCMFSSAFSLDAIGGCCGTTPSHIQALAERLNDACT